MASQCEECGSIPAYVHDDGCPQRLTDIDIDQWLADLQDRIRREGT